MSEIMYASKQCIDLIRHCTGFHAKVVLSPAGIPIQGYGSTRHSDGRPIALGDLPITMDDADAMLMAALKPSEAAVRRYVHSPITQDQFDALVSFCYDVGEQTFLQSKVLQHINAAEFREAATCLLHWAWRDGHVSPERVKRRTREQTLFESLYA